MEGAYNRGYGRDEGYRHHGYEGEGRTRAMDTTRRHYHAMDKYSKKAGNDIKAWQGVKVKAQRWIP